jgi:hypothetical protein
MEVCRNITEDLSGMFALQGRKSENSCRILFDDEGHRRIAQMTNPVEDDQRSVV